MSPGTKRLVHKVLTISKPRQQHIFKAVIQHVHDYSECNIRKLTLQAKECDYDSSAVFSYQAGQWVDFMIPGVEIVGGYSFLSCPGTGTRHMGTGTVSSTVGFDIQYTTLPFFDLAIKKSSHAPAAWIHSDLCSEGSEVEVRVGGDFTLDLVQDMPGTRTVCFFAGGVGINPLYSMILELLNRIEAEKDCKITGECVPSILLIWSVRSMSEAFLLPQLLKISTSSTKSNVLLKNKIRIVVTVTGEESSEKSSDNVILYEFSNTFRDIIHTKSSQDVNDETSDSCIIEKSRISSSLILNHMQSCGVNAFPVAFVCGPPSFSTDIVTMLTADCNFSPDNVFTESWW